MTRHTLTLGEASCPYTACVRDPHSECQSVRPSALRFTFVDLIHLVSNCSKEDRRGFWTKRIAAHRAKSAGWKRIAAEMGVGVGTVYRIALEGSKTREKVI